jgi:hypothetical protein
MGNEARRNDGGTNETEMAEPRLGHPSAIYQATQKKNSLT